MPNADFFSRLGVFVGKDFLDAMLCTRLRSEIQTANSSSAEVVRAGVALVDKHSRKVRQYIMTPQTTSLIRAGLLALTPQLEQHCQMAITGCEVPQFLVYYPGDFFVAHQDGGVPSGEDPPFLRNRKIAVVLFINSASEEPTANTYCGGALALYGLIDDPRCQSYGFPLIGEAGFLVAFRADTLHEVTPVTHGVRYTVVSWFF